MDFYVYDTDLNVVGIIDNYTSVIWTLRYNDAGDFEIYIKSSPDVLETCKPNYIVVRETDNTAMIIKSVVQAESAENGDYITVTGVSVESLLSQRIVWNVTTVSGRIEECIYTLVDVNCINPFDADRIIPRLKNAPSKRLTAEIELTDFTGHNVFEVVKSMCVNAGYGFKIVMSDDGFVFEVYAGVDRSENQTVNNQVVFEPGNLAESTLTNDYTNYKNFACVVGGSGDMIDRIWSSYGDATGLNRHEIFIDAGNEAQRTVILQSHGREELQNYTPVQTFDGELSSYYTYGVNYALGDIVQIETKNGITAVARISEIIQSIDDSGIYTIPTFSEWGLI